MLLREPTERDLLNVDLDAFALARSTRAAGGRVVLYAPTFRDGEMGTWIYGAGLSQIAQALAARGDRLLVNLHPLESGELPRLRQTFPNVHFVRERTDLYPLLREATQRQKVEHQRRVVGDQERRLAQQRIEVGALAHEVHVREGLSLIHI